MSKEELLKIFKMEELYNRKKVQKPFLYHFVDSLLCSGSSIIYYFYNEEIIISLKTKEFSKENKEQELFLTFKINDKNLLLSKNSQDFKNELFPFLDFKTTLEADLEFISGIVNNILIPKYNLKWNFSIIDY